MLNHADETILIKTTDEEHNLHKNDAPRITRIIETLQTLMELRDKFCTKH